ncbi:MAG: 5'-3'-deoxyribonucleotidase [Cardiobacterium sp.]|nr:MAG: 5'-3'-deoxyribonucleotidase [Cardiobacterium sp.]
MIILLDQDGVLADFEHGIAHGWQSRYGTPVPLPQPRQKFYVRDEVAPEHKDALIDLYSAAGFFAGLRPVSGALDAARALLAAGHDVRICTAPITNYRHCVGEKIAWVEQHLGFDWTARVILTKDKTLIHGDILIDDKPDISGVRTPDWQHWHYDAPYNRHIPATHRVRWDDPASWNTLLNP